jgi:Fe-S-cluster containining protein
VKTEYMAVEVEVPRTFACRRCGRCCRGHGYVWIFEEDVERLAKALKLEVSEFTRRYTRLTRDRRGLSLTEKEGGDCVFLDEPGYCRVNDVKPQQCREFPSGWNYSGFERFCRGMEPAS